MIAHSFHVIRSLVSAFVKTTSVRRLNLVTLVVSIASVAAFNPGPSATGDIVFLMPSVLFIQLFFMVVGVAFAAIMHRPRHAGMLSAAVLLATFILSAFVDIANRFQFLRYLTPFQYFDPKAIFAGHAYSLTYITIATAAVAVMLAAARLVYNGRDFSL